MTDALRGEELIESVKSLGDVSKDDLVRACGYVSTDQNGEEILESTDFFEALLEARGIV